MADDPTGAAPAATPLAPASSAPENLEARLWAAIQRWRDAHIAGGPIARATECWNHLQTALAHLAASIMKEF